MNSVETQHRLTFGSADFVSAPGSAERDLRAIGGALVRPNGVGLIAGKPRFYKQSGQKKATR
jgi:hypothetical protein